MPWPPRANASKMFNNCRSTTKKTAQRAGILVAVIIILLNYGYSFSQKKATIIDGVTKEKVSYVNIWVENENTGTTSNENGEFELNIDGSKNILFSAIGFEKLKINSDSIKDNVELTPLIFELKEVVVKSESRRQELIIGKFKKSKINIYFGCGRNPWIVARYFEHKEIYNKTPFISRIRVLTNSDVKDAKFNVRFYGINEAGEPAGFIHSENIIGVAKKGNKITEIDISDLGIKFPKEGFFLAFEWFIIEPNKYEYKYSMQNSRKKLNGISFEPSFGTVPYDTDANSWIFTRGKWVRMREFESRLKKHKNTYRLLAIELTLTN